MWKGSDVLVNLSVNENLTAALIELVQSQIAINKAQLENEANLKKAIEKLEAASERAVKMAEAQGLQLEIDLDDDLEDDDENPWDLREDR